MKKAVVLAGGLGVRLRPATLVTNKHLLPIYSSAGAVPMLFYPIHTLVKSGIKDILIISSREHCGHIIENLSDGSQFGADFSYKIQDHDRVALGIASALKLARNFTNNEPFAVILGDNFFEDSFSQDFENFSNSSCGAKIFVKEVPDINRFGCATLRDGKVIKIIEKPVQPESHWAVTGLYLYKPDVYEILPSLCLSKRGELEITDVNSWYVEKGLLEAAFISGFWSDMGTPESLQRTQKHIGEKI